MPCPFTYTICISRYLPIIKHGNGKGTTSVMFLVKAPLIGIFYCHVWLPEGTINIMYIQINTWCTNHGGLNLVQWLFQDPKMEVLYNIIIIFFSFHFIFIFHWNPYVFFIFILSSFHFHVLSFHFNHLNMKYPPFFISFQNLSSFHHH